MNEKTKKLHDEWNDFRMRVSQRAGEIDTYQIIEDGYEKEYEPTDQEFYMNWFTSYLYACKCLEGLVDGDTNIDSFGGYEFLIKSKIEDMKEQIWFLLRDLDDEHRDMGQKLSCWIYRGKEE